MMTLPLMAFSQTNRITTLQNARQLVVNNGQEVSHHLLKTGESLKIYRKDGQLMLNDTPLDANASLRLQSLTRYAIDEDSSAFNNKYTINYGLLAFRRSMNVGQWNSICVPFSLTGSQLLDAFGEDTQVAALQNVTDGDNPTVEFQTLDLKTNDIVMEANQHYLIRPSREPDIAAGSQTSVNYGKTKVTGPVYAIAGVTLESGQTPKLQSMRSDDKSTTVRLRGSYGSRDVALGSNPRYVLSDEGRFYQLTATMSQKAFRSYIEDASQESHDHLRFYINGVDEDISDVTAIAVLSVPKESKTGVYDLQGRRVNASTLKKGLYIVDGKKIMMR